MISDIKALPPLVFGRDSGFLRWFARFIFYFVMWLPGTYIIGYFGEDMFRRSYSHVFYAALMAFGMATVLNGDLRWLARRCPTCQGNLIRTNPATAANGSAAN
ncbi:hypothetical protein B7486_19615 [cyanobacterium TDX16]|nr:hypothetical protein B7486_19615 [cyanobacterium TDX16]